MGRQSSCPTNCGITRANYIFCHANISSRQRSLLLTETSATRWHILKIKCIKFDFG